MQVAAGTTAHPVPPADGYGAIDGDGWAPWFSDTALGPPTRLGSRALALASLSVVAQQDMNNAAGAAKATQMAITTAGVQLVLLLDAAEQVGAAATSGAAASGVVGDDSDDEDELVSEMGMRIDGSDSEGGGESEADELDDDEYEIEEIVELVEKSKPMKWLVKWAGCSLDRNNKLSYVLRSAFTIGHGYEMLLKFERDRKAAGVEANGAPKRKQRA